MVSDSPFSAFLSNKRTPSPHFSSSSSRRIFSDVVGDVVIDVDGRSFLLHKLPLVSRSGRIYKMVVNSRDPNISNLVLEHVPGGPQTFELAAKFCYGTNFEINTSNVAQLRCVAEYLEMTEDYKGGNLISRTEMYLNDIVLPSLEKSLEVLRACEHLLPVAEEVGILNKCVDAIALNASKEQLISGLTRLDCDIRSERPKADISDWWIDDISLLRIDVYQRIISAMRKTGVRSDSITKSLVHYAQSSLKDSGTNQFLDTGIPVEDEQRKIIEMLVRLLVAEKVTSIPLSLLFGMLRMAVLVDAALSCRHELERRIGFQMDMASLDDLLIPSLHARDSLFDVDTVHRILVNFFQWVEEEDRDEFFRGESESEILGSPTQSSILKVGRLIDEYLAEIAPDSNLKLHKFMSIIELLPDYAHVIDDGLYRAIDIYLKAHPSLSESECKKLCMLVDCQKLSQQASNHAAQNDRLPVQLVVRILYFEQLRLKSSLSADTIDGFFSQRMISSSGAPSAAVSPRDNYASLRRENRELRLEISRMRARLSDLEKEHEFMKRGMREGKSTDHGKAFFAALSRGFGRIGFFGPTGDHQQKCTRKLSASETKKRRQRTQRKRSSDI